MTPPSESAAVPEWRTRIHGAHEALVAMYANQNLFTGLNAFSHTELEKKAWSALTDDERAANEAERSRLLDSSTNNALGVARAAGAGGEA